MNASPTYLKDYRPSLFKVSHTDLTFELDPNSTRVNVIYKIQRQDVNDCSPLILQGENLTLVKVEINGHLLSPEHYYRTDQQLSIYDCPNEAEVHIETLISPAQNKELMGLYASANNFCTQCEAEGFRRITYALDRPDILSIFTTKLIANADQYPTLLSNGNLIETGILVDGKHFAVWHDPFPKPCYLFALVAGSFDQISGSFTTQSGRDVKIHIYTDKGQADQCYHALEAVKKSMLWDEINYGLEYDLDLFMIVAVNDFNFGAMENKGLNIFNAKYILARQETATDSDFNGVETVVAHEYFHNWSGNRVTLRDWFQLSLKEGLTVYRDQSFDEDNISKTVHRINIVNRLRSMQFKEDQGPMAHPVQPQSYMKIDNFYTTTIYNKGAEVIRMFHLLLGDHAYRQACDDYFSRFDGQAVTIQDFADIMQAHSDFDLSPFLLWYTQAGTPRVHIRDEYDADTQRYTLHINQEVPNTVGQHNKKPMLIPMKMALIDVHGKEVPTPNLYRGSLLLIDQEQQSVSFDNITDPVTPSFFRHFSAPIRCNYEYNTEQLEHLMRHDQDGVNRWQAAQLLALAQLNPMIEAYQTGSAYENLKSLVQTRYINLMREVLKEKVTDQYYHAQLIALPSESYLAENMPMIHVEAIHYARKALKLVLAHELYSEFQTIYHQCSQNAHPHYDIQQMGRRVLRNTCLSYLSSVQQPLDLQRAWDQFNQSLTVNMTDATAALSALSHSDSPYCQQAFDLFYQQWSSQALVMNKWFSIQAMAHKSNILDTVNALMKHKVFSIENPNNVYALIYGFAINNPMAFHDISGTGYDFLATQVIHIDRINPMVAARIITPLTHWRRYDETRSQLMKQALEKIMQQSEMSDNLNECVSKSLEE
jgi:aminopeptidase N